MYHYSARQALMAAKRQELMNQAARAKAVREARAARGRRLYWFARSKDVAPAGVPARPAAQPEPVAEHAQHPQPAERPAPSQRVRGFEAAPPRPAESAL